MDGFHAYKHWDVYADKGSHPRRHGGGCGYGFAYRSRRVVVTLASELRRSFSAGHDECGENFHLGVFGLGRRRFLARCSASESPAGLGERWCMARGHSFRRGSSRIAGNTFRVGRRRRSMLSE